MVDPVSRIVFSDFYDLVRTPKKKEKKKCLRCGAPTIGDRVCNKCAKFVERQSRMAQDGINFRVK